MSLYALPVTSTDISQLQQGILFTTTSAADINNQVSAINATGATETVNSYANQLLATVQNTSQVAMGVTGLMAGQAQSVATLTNLVTNPAIIPTYVSFALAQGLDVGEVVGENLGLAFSGNTNFVNNFGGLSLAAFTQQMLGLTGINQSFTANQVQFFINLYTAGGLPGIPSPTQAQIQAAAYGVVFGLDVALNIEGVGSQATTNQTLVKNALFDIAQTSSSPPGQKYAAGSPLTSQPVPTPFQGAGGPPQTNVFLTTGVDTPTQGFANSTGTPLNPPGFTATASNSTVNGTFGGAGATWTPGDMVIAAAGTTGQIFNISGVGPAGAIDPTSVGPGNKVSGFQTVTITGNAAGGVTNQAVKGDFTASGTEGAWAGMTTLTIVSAGNGANADTIKVDPTVALSIQDTLTAATTTPLTVNGSLTTTITEANSAANGGITVNGGNGTTTVKITQTELAPGQDGIVKITDAGFATKAAGTITDVTLDGLSNQVGFTFTSPGPGLVLIGTPPNTISDNALKNLTINNSDSAGAAISIIDNLTPATATTLNLNLSHDGVGALGFAVGPGFGNGSALVLVDTNNEISTIHLTLGSQNSYMHLVDNGLVTLDTASAGSGALVSDSNGLLIPSTITDNGGSATFDFSGLNGPNNVDVDRVSGAVADVYTLGNFGTNAVGASPFTTAQHLVIENTNINNKDTINFGSGAYLITDAPHNSAGGAIHTYVDTAPNGTALAAGFSATLEPWALIFNAGPAAPLPNGDVLIFKGDTITNTFNGGAVANVQLGITGALANPQHSATFFNVAGNTFVFDHAGTSTVNISPTDALVEFVGIVFNAGSTIAGVGVHLA